MTDISYEAAIRRIVAGEIESGRKSLVSVLRACEGAHPEVVQPILEELLKANGNGNGNNSSSSPTEMDAPPMFTSRLGHLFRARVAELFCAMPAPNPELAQWWFDLDSIEYLTHEIERVVDDASTVLCVGVPTVAFALSIRGISATLLDEDVDVLDRVRAALLEEEKKKFKTGQFRAGRDSIERFVPAPVSVAIIDPPWYMGWFAHFLECSVSMLEPGGSLFMTLLPRLTRPNAELNRAEVVSAIHDAGLCILAVERARLGYIVPRFEKSVYETIAEFTGLPWRRGDLVHATVGGSKVDPTTFRRIAGGASSSVSRDFQVYTRSSTQLRVFVGSEFVYPPIAHSDSLLLWTEPNYSTTVSSQGRAGGMPPIWTSEKAGLWAVDEYTLETARQALAAWEDDCTKDQANERVSNRPRAREVVDTLDDLLELWARFESLAEPRQQVYPSGHRNDEREREHGPADDPYRSSFFRDRDRIVWSDGLRKLANKTQVFPASRDDQLRQRLAHSLEVVQLATTLGQALSLDLQLIEAGALAHDIGHTPFGHAGEHALHYVMAQANHNLFFNHYEHGVDVVRYLEAAYQHHPGHPGLNLTRGTIDCIFKHVYFHETPTSGGSPCGGASPRSVPEAPNSLTDLHQRSKHRDFLTADYCHAEGQAVRLADKISYLLSDIEDGVRLGAISFEDIRSCSLFLRPPIDFTSRFGESLSAVFGRERRNILRVLMEDAIHASSRLLHQARWKGGTSSRTIDHSVAVQHEVGEVWRRLQAGRLHRFPAVRQSNLHAAKVVSELFVVFSLIPDMIDERFREAHENLTMSQAGCRYIKFYEDIDREVEFGEELRSVIPLERTIGEHTRRVEEGKVSMRDFILAKDYVASLSDGHAEDLHARLLV